MNTLDMQGLLRGVIVSSVIKVSYLQFIPLLLFCFYYYGYYFLFLCLIKFKF